MFGDKDRALKLVSEDAMTVLDKGAEFDGKLTFEGKVQINGKFRGEVFSGGVLIIGEGAEDLPEPFVAPFIEQVQVDLTQGCQSAAP